jgi:probable DNA repair protein
VRGAWHELLDDWMRAETITPPMTIAEALASVRELAETTVFQPESPPAAVQILGFLEAAGLPFDALWVSGLTAERWPPAPMPNPLLPLDWQRRVGAPHASAEHELRYYRALTAQLASAADTVVLSWPASIDDIPQTPSALLLERSLPAAPDLFGAIQPGLAHLIRLAGRVHAIEDADGLPVVAGRRSSANASLVEAAAHCPFQGYARHRLDVEPWPEPRAGIDAMERGTLVHCMLSEFWNGVRERDALLRLSDDERQARIVAAVDVALARIPQARWKQLGPRMRELERARLAALLDEWLALDAERPPFRVIETETKHALDLAGLPLRLRIDSVDAIDGDRRVVIDYKTGPSPLHSLQGGTRLIAPQLPLYLEALAEPDVVGVAYAKVRRGKCEAQGIGNPEDWDALKPALPDWPARRAHWQRALAQLAQQILEGRAAVDPWRYPQSCSRCHRHALCRINERLGFVDGSDDAKGEGGGQVGGAVAA